MDREVRRLKRSRIPIVKVWWNLKRGPEFTWEREDHMKVKYLNFFGEQVADENFCCSKKGHEDKIRVPKPTRNCARYARCGTPVDGPYCQGCALLRKEFMEDLFTYCVENEFFKDLQDTSESSDDNTNVANAPQEPFVDNQDPV
ncbi:hypothetical protein Tco_1568113 [Tanacetum coccineum]